ncbi:MAG: LacI family transcriptional regulator [Candidatus Margulisbacteria bacterium]|nr:LacI family transcriptional regulator [Candidatus Margulisiibacteriota bacterium]
MNRRKNIRIKDIAKRLGISVATVSQALNHPKEVNRSTRQEVLSLCEELGYVKPLKGKKRTYHIAVISRDCYNFANDFYAKVCEQLLHCAKQQKYNLIFEAWGDDQADLPLSISRRRIDGVIILGNIHREKALLIKQQQLPLVLCGHPLPDLELHTVMPDGKSGSYQACKHLIDLGHKKIATIAGGAIFDPVSRDRIEGYRYALIESGLTVAEEYIMIANFHLYSHADQALAKLLALKEPPTAIVCASDTIAYRIHETLTAKKIRVPHELSLTGFDNFALPEYAKGVLPKLTTVEVNVKELAKYTLEILLELMAEPTKVAWRYTLPVKLVTGETTGKPR